MINVERIDVAVPEAGASKLPTKDIRPFANPHLYNDTPGVFGQAHVCGHSIPRLHTTRGLFTGT